MAHLPTIDFIFKERDFRYKNNDSGQLCIWDVVRRKYIVYTPEEKIRQHIIHSFIYDYHIPAAWISVEKLVMYNGQKKRFDILVYKNAKEPYLLVECKAPEVAINVNTVLQLSMYYSQLPSEYLMISNGVSTCLMRINDKKGEWQSEWNVSLN